MKQITAIVILPLFIMLSLGGCQSNSDHKFKKVDANSVEGEKYSAAILKDTTDCFLLLKMLQKECFARNARLNVLTLEQIVLFVPSDNYLLDCNQFMLGNILVSVNHQFVNFNIVGNDRPKEDEPVRKFYLMDYKNGNGYKTMELWYFPSGSIFKMVVKMEGGKSIIEDFFCANF